MLTLFSNGPRAPVVASAREMGFRGDPLVGPASPPGTPKSRPEEDPPAGHEERGHTPATRDQFAGQPRGLAFDTISGFPVPVDLLVYTQDEWRRLEAEKAPFVRRLRAEVAWVA